MSGVWTRTTQPTYCIVGQVFCTNRVCIVFLLCSVSASIYPLLRLYFMTATQVVKWLYWFFSSLQSQLWFADTVQWLCPQRSVKQRKAEFPNPRHSCDFWNIYISLHGVLLLTFALRKDKWTKCYWIFCFVLKVLWASCCNLDINGLYKLPLAPW